MKQRHWMDREGNRRPTRERQKKSKGWRFADAEDAGTSYAMDETGSPIQAAYAFNQIDARQWDASCLFLEITVRHKGPTGRSCLNFEPVGHDETDGDEDAERKYKEVARELPFVVWNEVINVVYREEPITSLESLREGLNDIADILGVD